MEIASLANASLPSLHRKRKEARKALLPATKSEAKDADKNTNEELRKNLQLIQKEIRRRIRRANRRPHWPNNSRVDGHGINRRDRRRRK